MPCRVARISAKIHIAPHHQNDTFCNECTVRPSTGARRKWGWSPAASQIWLDGRTLAVRANSMIYLPAGDEHEIRAAAAQDLEFFAITAPAFSPDDYVQLPP